MAVPFRHGSPPGTYFITSRTWQSRTIFNVAARCTLFIESLLKYREDGIFRLHGFVLMPDHFHVLITPGETASLERAVQFIKGGSAKKLKEVFQFRFPVWQRGFSDHRIRDAADFRSHVRYLEQNPVKRHLVAAPVEFNWSSASGRFLIDEIPQGLKPLNATRTGTAEAVP